MTDSQAKILLLQRYKRTIALAHLASCWLCPYRASMPSTVHAEIDLLDKNHALAYGWNQLNRDRITIDVAMKYGWVPPDPSEDLELLLDQTDWQSCLVSTAGWRLEQIRRYAFDSKWREWQSGVFFDDGYGIFEFFDGEGEEINYEAEPESNDIEGEILDGNYHEVE